jgi:hypothetical protein
MAAIVLTAAISSFSVGGRVPTIFLMNILLPLPQTSFSTSCRIFSKAFALATLISRLRALRASWYVNYRWPLSVGSMFGLLACLDSSRLTLMNSLRRSATSVVHQYLGLFPFLRLSSHASVMAISSASTLSLFRPDTFALRRFVNASRFFFPRSTFWPGRFLGRCL